MSSSRPLNTPGFPEGYVPPSASLNPVEEHIVQALIHTESGEPARQRVGGGEIVHRTKSHQCLPPSDRAEFDLGTVWRCDCGWRWKLAGPSRIWLRRYWPWPR